MLADLPCCNNRCKFLLYQSTGCGQPSGVANDGDLPVVLATEAFYRAAMKWYSKQMARHAIVLDGLPG